MSRVPAQFAVVLVAIVFCAAFVRFVFADVGNSANFRASQSINDFSGVATSTSFNSITTGGQFVSGESTSSNFTLAAGFEYFDSFTPLAKNWRWYDDETNETPSIPLEAENIAPSGINNNEIIKLRIAVMESANIGQAGTKFRLQFSPSTDFSSATFVVESGACTSSSVWCYASGAGADNSLISTATLSGTDACVSSVGDGCGTHNTSGTSVSSFTHAASTTREYEFTIQPSGAGPNATYFFRLYDTASDSAVPLQDTATFPSISTQSGTLSFVINGVATSSSAGGVTTNVGSVPQVVPFGTLPINTSLTSAHQLVVSTNATAGYQIYVFQPQGFVGDRGAEITPFNGTNDSPTSWTSGCSLSAAGCYGYHTDAAVLHGGSTRFAADDTYAQFTQQLSEVAYSATPVESATTTVVYRVEAHSSQESQDYSTNVTYIVVPTF